MKPNETATSDTGIAISLVSWERVTIAAGAPGEIAGEGVSLRVQITNRSTDSLDLSNVIADLRFGPGLTPAAGSDRPPTDPFTSSLPPGASATATYAFLIDGDERDDVVLLLSLNPELPVVAFDGALR